MNVFSVQSILLFSDKRKKHLQIMRRIEWRWVSVVEQGVRECAQGYFFLRDFAFNESSVD